jgi:tRNA(fMet)-specific endonuclease VapC
VILLDTNACIDFAKARSDRLRDRLEEAFEGGLAISAVTLAELRVGARASGADPQDSRRLDMLVRSLTLLDFDAAAAEEYADIVREVGVKRRSFDRLIAAHARSRGLLLVTNNERDFADVPGLRVENWTQ